MQTFGGILVGMITDIMVGAIGYDAIYKPALQLGGIYPTVAIFAIVVLCALPWIAIAKLFS